MRRLKNILPSRAISPAPLVAIVAVGIFQSLSVLPAAGGDWPCFHGPNHDGVSTESGWSVSWPEAGPNKLWGANVGVGFSSVAVADGRAYTMGNIDGKTDFAYGFDAKTGKVIWKQSYPCPLDAKYYEGGTHATPTVDGGKVYTVSKHGQVYCLDAATGLVIWSKNVADEAGATRPTWGFAGSAFIDGDRILLNIGSGGTALDKTSGKILWKSGPDEAGYSTAVPCEFGGEKCVVFFEKYSVMAARIQDGKPMWNHLWKTAYEVNAADPLVWNNQVFIASGYKKGCCLLQVEGGKPQVVWQGTIIRDHFNNSVRIGDYLYGMDGDMDEQNPMLRCVEWKTGAEKWAEKVDAIGSTTAADGKLIVLTGKGQLIVASADPSGFKPLAKAHVLDGKCWTVPTLANGRLYCRNAQGTLICLDLSGAK